MSMIRLSENHNAIVSISRMKKPGMFISMEEEIWRKPYVRAKVVKIYTITIEEV
jgi:hypothetical protein